MNRFSNTAILSLSAAVMLSACTVNGPNFSTFNAEAGGLSSSTGFGESTRINTEAMTREVDYTIDLSKKFNSDVDTTVYFDFGSAKIDSRAKIILTRQADWISQFPEIKFTVYGYTDRVGVSFYNRTLGQRRAQAVVDFLTSHGVEKSRLKAVVSKGESNPAVDTNDRERLNRRAITEVSGFVEGNPRALDGAYAAIIYRDYIASGVVTTTLETVADTVTATAGTQ